MENGQLSYSKVRALTRVADADTEDHLLQIALHGTAGHEKRVRHFRRSKEAGELSREAAQQSHRTCTYLWDEDGSLVLKAHLPAAAGALVLRALEAALNEVPFEADAPATAVVDVSAETLTVKLSPSVRRADALALMAESFVADGPAVPAFQRKRAVASPAIAA